MSQFTEHGNSLSFPGLARVQLAMQLYIQEAMLLTVYLESFGVIYKRKKLLPPEGTEGDGMIK